MPLCFGAFGSVPADLTSASVQSALIRVASDKLASAALTTQTTGANAFTYWLHQTSDPVVTGSPCSNLVKYMDQSDSSAEPEPCYDPAAVHTRP